MARIIAGQPELNPKSVLEFFDRRAQNAPVQDHYAVTVFMDREAAEERHITERDQILSLLKVASQKLGVAPLESADVLDIGCGGGRWAKSLVLEINTPVRSYVGLDFAKSLIELAIKQELGPKALFQVARIEDLSHFGKIQFQSKTHALAVAVSKYMNDRDVQDMFHAVYSLLSQNGVFYIREGMSFGDQRLSLVDEPSQALGENYNAVYRTKEEYRTMIKNSGFEIMDEGLLGGQGFQQHDTTGHYFFIGIKK